MINPLTVGCCKIYVSQGGSPVWVTITIKGQQLQVNATELPDIAHAIERARAMARVEMRRVGDEKEIGLA